MENKDFNKLFNQNFDTAEPSLGHFNRFEKRLANQKTIYKPKKWKWYIMAASFALLFTFWFASNTQNEPLQLADVSPEMAETQSYFTSVIKSEIEKINIQKTPQNKKLIDDAFIRLKNLETQYTTLSAELSESGSDKRVIFAMISNFQQRIEVLQDLLEQLEEIKQFKNLNNETYS